MEKKNKLLSSNSIVAGLMTTAFAVVMGLLWSYWFDLNDDVMMKDILSGVYTGAPEAHNIQMLYPISLLISLFYRAFGKADCYGIFLVVCQYISLFVIIRGFVRVMSDAVFMRAGYKFNGAVKILIKCISSVLIFFVFFALMPGHFVIVQYTFTVAMICAAAAVLFAEKRDKTAIAFVMVAFLIRSEMLLLLLPFVVLVIFYRCSYGDYPGKDKEQGQAFEYGADRGKLFSEKNIKRNIIPVLAIAGGLLLMELLHFAGYNTPGWREFNSFFDSRTKIYDFYQIPDYDENREFYDSIGLKESEQALLVNYNFGIDDDIDAEKMEQIAEYAKSIRNDEGLLSKLKRALPLYLYRLRCISPPEGYEYPMTDAPWNIVAGLMYLISAIMIYMNARADGYSTFRAVFSPVWRLTILFAGRTLLWMYIMVRERDPIRITHSLYLLEIAVLFILSAKLLLRVIGRSFYYSYGAQSSNEYMADIFHYFAGFCLITFLAMCMRYIPVNLRIVADECKGRAEYNRAYEELDAYCRQNPDSFYFMDVYTSVAYEDNGFTYSQSMFGNVDNSVSNIILMGGWASKSPIEEEKLRLFGLPESMEKAVLDDKAYIIADKDNELHWIEEYYKDKGVEVRAVKEGDVAGEFAIWKLVH